MNRYAAAGIVADAKAGRRVLVLTVTERAMRDVVDGIRREEPVAQYARVNGRDTIRIDGAEPILIQPVLATVRGYSVDIIYLDTDADRCLTLDDWRGLQTVLATSSVGEIVRA